jgi:hypothetical protein
MFSFPDNLLALLAGVVDCHPFDADLDLDPTFHFDADPDPDHSPRFIHDRKSELILLLFTEVPVYIVLSFLSV